METCEKNPNKKLIFGNDSRPYIDIQWKTGKLFISNAVFKHIGKPDAIRLLWNPTKCSLIIQPAKNDDPDSFPVTGKRYAECGSLLISSVTFIYKIWLETDWDKTLNYRTVGKYNERHNVVVFDLKKAIASEIPRNVRGGGAKKTA
jgi:hypothetical protein